MEFNTVIQNRYSCRAFLSKPVEPEKVDRILDAGRIAPTAVNKQPVHVWAVSNPGTDGYELVAMINVGYPSDESTPSAMHDSRIPMEEFVTTV